MFVFMTGESHPGSLGGIPRLQAQPVQELDLGVAAELSGNVCESAHAF
jgi:hypothetical protein